MARKRTKQVSPPGTAAWADLWESFLARHGCWWRGMDRGAPLYALPPPVVSALATSTPRSGVRQGSNNALLATEEAASEEAFWETCQAYNSATVGVWRDRPVEYEPLALHTALELSQTLIRDLGWEQIGAVGRIEERVRELGDKAEHVRRTQLGYAGWLTFNSQYREERDSLQRRLDHLSVPHPWPIQIVPYDAPPLPMSDKTLLPGERLPNDVARFMDDVTAFLRRWQLKELVTWDFPVSQGPLHSVPHGLAARLLGPDQATTSVPAYYDIPSDANLRAEVQASQRQAAVTTGIEGEYPLTHLGPRDGHPSTYEAAFRLWLLERAATQRYGGRRGLVAQLSRGFLAMLGRSAERIKQLRAVYSPFLKVAGPSAN